MPFGKSDATSGSGSFVQKGISSMGFLGKKFDTFERAAGGTHSALGFMMGTMGGAPVASAIRASEPPTITG